MQKLKKALLTVLSMVLVAVIAVGATLAYLTDTDSEVNVMTVGNVQVELQEKQRNEDRTALVDFVQGKELTPLVGSAQGTKDQWGQPVSTNYVDKIVYATNTGKNDAYVRFLVAIPTALIPDTEDSSNNPLHWSFGNRVDITGTGKYNTVAYADSDWKKLFGGYDDVKDADGKIASVTIDGEEYWVTYFPMAEALAPKADSLAVMAGMYLDNRVDYDADLGKYTFNGTAIDYDFSKGVRIPVMVQAVQTAGFQNADEAFTAAYGNVTVANAEAWFNGVEAPTVVSNAEELTEALTAASAAKSGDNTIYLADDIDLTEDWTPISVDGYHGAGIVTVEGQGNTITGLTAPLFDGGFAGESGIIIRDLTIADSEIKSDNTQGVGAFISCVDSMTTITLENCHLLNSTVDAPEARTGGLIGWTSGYSKQDDGPVKTYVTITDCSVVGCKITGTAVGGINGHAGASDWTFTTIENCTVLNNELISYDDGEWRVGAVVGTANIGEVTIKGTVSGGNTMTQEAASSQRAEGLSDLVGRFVPDTTGKLTVEGTVQAATASKQEDLDEAVSSGADVITLNEGTYTIPNVSNTSYTIVGNGDDVVVDQSASVITRNNTDIVFENVTIQGTSDNYRGLQAGNVVYNNCVFEGGNHLYSKSVTFNNCTFNLTSQYITTYGATEVTFNNCTWNTAGKALLVFQDGSSVDQVVTVKNNTFNATAAAYTWNNIHIAAVSIDGSAPTTNGTFAVNFEGNNVVDDDFAGLCQIKGEKEDNVTVTGATPSDLVYKAE